MEKVWMIFTLAVSSALAQFACPDMFGFPCSSSVGLFADPFSCEHFYLCANGHPYRQKCPFGLIFDGAVCNWKYDRSCRFQDRLRLSESNKKQINKWPKDPQRPSKIDIPKIPKTSTQITQDSSIPYSTLDETTISVSDAMTEEVKREDRQQVKFPTVTPVEAEITPLEDKNFTQPQEPLEETTQNLQENENVETQTPKVQSRWKEIQRRQQQRRQQQQWMIQRQRQWRLHQRWKLQQQWRNRQKTQRLQKQQRENRLLNGSFNGTTTSTRLMPGKTTTPPGFTSRRLISNEDVSRRPSWTEQRPRSENKTSPPLLFPIRHKTHFSAPVAIQAFGSKKSVDNSKDISNNSINSNFSILNENDNKNYSINSFILDSRSMNTNNSSVNNTPNSAITDDNISINYNNTHVINNVTNNSISNDNNNISIHINNNSTYNKNNFNVDINSNNDTNTNLTTSHFMNNINTTFLNSSNRSNISNYNHTVLEKEYDTVTDTMFLFGSSENSTEKSDFSEPFTNKETTENFSTS